MYVEKLTLHNFRCFDRASFDFSDGLHAIVGDNGQGKTTLLEALFFCITATSFRTNHVKELIRFGQECLWVEVRFKRLGVSHTLSVGYDGKMRKVCFNGAPCSSTTELLGLISGVACTPEDIELIQGPPAVRRRYLDLFLAQTQPFYVYHLRRYVRALKQRNVLLKEKKKAMLFCWEKELAQSGAYIAYERKKAVASIEKQAQTELRALFGSDVLLEIGYNSFCRSADSLEAITSYLLQEFTKKQAQELEQGMTLTGPHRDDLDIRLEKRSAKEYASIGQKRLIGHALRLAEWHYLHRACEEAPLMIVDDFATSLDSSKSCHLASSLTSLGQVFVSSTQIPTLSSCAVASVVELKR